MTYPGGIELAAALRRAGLESGDIRRLRRSGELIDVRRGVYARTPTADPRLHHIRQVAAAVACWQDVWVSHTSAALLHGLPYWPPELATVHLTKARANGGRRLAGVHLHVQPLTAEETTEIDALPVTALTRTVVDALRLLDVERGVMLGDAALRAGLSRVDLAAALAGVRGRTGAATARSAARLLDPRAESPGESRSRLVLHRAGLPAPELQFEVMDGHGVLIARSDFGWPELRTLGEFDGKIKYGRLLRPGEDPGDAVFREKRREDQLRDLGWQVVRWVWAELSTPEVIADRLLRAFARGRRAA